ncbi:MAG: hypothetical protein CSA95_09170 [Bacteroidetes bacterium]|nr:MAG: hypothetical protein CSA95_09170 [Bacteroidota bacterium]
MFVITARKHLLLLWEGGPCIIPMAMKHRVVLPLFLLWLFWGAACTPEREPSLPEISSFHLLADDSLHALDTLSYALVVASESPIRSVKLQLKREEGSVLLSHLVDESGAVRVDIGEGLFILSRKGLETGRYRFEVLVSNEDGSRGESPWIFKPLPRRFGNGTCFWGAGDRIRR